jgi:triphosphatase
LAPADVTEAGRRHGQEAALAQEDREIELKFLCEPRDLDAVLAAAPAGETEVKLLSATYFDTPDEALAKARIALRVRGSGGRHIQTLKQGEGFSRQEQETTVAGAGLDLAMPALKAALKPAARRRLEPRFTVTVRRRQRLVVHQGAEIELAIDEGEVAAAGQSRPISEVELELKSGDPAALFHLARQLSRTAPLYLSFESKSARGQALRDGREGRARKSDKAALKPGLSTAQAFQAVARDALGQIAANALLLREAGGADALHQLRVALRRLRSAISTFRPIVADDQAQAIKAELRWLTRACDEARDLDVFANDNARLEERSGRGDGLGPAVEAARSAAHAKAGGAVASKRFRDLVLDATAWVETGAWLTAGGKAEARRGRPARRFAQDALDRRWKRVARAGRHLAGLDDERRHRLRIAAKKLRYAVEAFGPLFEAKAIDRFVARLKDLQDQLGALNDTVVAGRLVERLHPKGDELAAARRLLAARDQGRAKLVKAAAKAMDGLLESAHPWDG